MTGRRAACSTFGAFAAITLASRALVRAAGLLLALALAAPGAVQAH